MRYANAKALAGNDVFVVIVANVAVTIRCFLTQLWVRKYVRDSYGAETVL